MICPAPENWLNVISVVPNVTVPEFVHTNPEFAFIVPDSTKQKDPLISVFASKSVALVHELPDTTK